MIPEFDEHGLLPPGVHTATWEEIERRFGGTAHRRRLLSGLRRAVENLAQSGCRKVYIDGSFATSKETPADFDACWEEHGVDPASLDPVLLSFGNRRSAQKAKYHGELFPSSSVAGSGPHFLVFLKFFQQDRETGRPKGIVALDLEEFAE